MLSFSPEGTFVLVLFQLVLSGLAFAVLVWIQLRHRRDESPLPIRVLTAGFALMTAAFAARAFHCRFAVYSSPSDHPAYYWLLLSSDLLRLFGASSLVGGYLLMRGRRRTAVVIAALCLGLSLLVAARFSADADLSARNIVPFTTARAAEAAVLLLGAALVWRTHALPAAALLVLGLSRLTAALGAWHPTVIELAWSFEHAGTLTALILLALALERESGERSLRFFLRLNLTFIVLASSLILAVAEIERRQFAEFAALQSEDLAEFVRGHTLYYTQRGEPPHRVLSHDDVIRKVVAEFGRYPDLRVVQVSLRGQTMALSINREGEIAQQYWKGERAPPPRVSATDFSASSLVLVPIVLAGQRLGSVELVHSLERINERIGWQMQLVFMVFTFFVAAASLVNGMLVIAADRTIRQQFEELERTESRLSTAERLASIGAVVDGVAHEINNPAGILVARADYLLSVAEGNPLSAEIRDDLDTIRRQAQRIARTVKDLLTFTRPSSLRRDSVAVHGVIEAAVDLVRPMIVEKGLALESRFAREMFTVCGDANRLEQVFINLLTNAVQATAGEGQITLSTHARSEGREVEIVVRDTGSGIPADHLERIFDPFFTTKQVGKGTGLGLSITYGIIRDHDGAIDVTTTPGVGSEFRVRLPLAQRRRSEDADAPTRGEDSVLLGATAVGGRSHGRGQR